MPDSEHQTIEELEELVGEQVRAARIARGLDQASLAALADVSVRALSNLERGHGSRLATLAAVARALGLTGWLSSLAPAPAVSPLALLRASRRERPRLRVRARRRPHAAGH